ncbi:putative tetratricopeptide-like helical domain superfamily [Dioscorea sansibarensis]
MILKPSSPSSLLKLGLAPTIESLNFLLFSITQSNKLALIPSLVSQFTSVSSTIPRSSLRCLIFTLSARGEPERAVQVLEMMKYANVGLQVDDFVASSIVSGFTKIGKPELGLGFYEKIEEREGFRSGLVTLTAVVDALCRIGRVGEACELVREMEAGGLVLDEVLYSCWISGLFRNGDLMEGLRKHCLMVENGIMPDVVSYSVVIDGLCKEGSVEKVVGFLDEMKRKGIEPNLVIYTSIIQGFCERGKVEEAFSILKKVEESGIVLHEFVYAILIHGLCKVGDLDRVFGVLEDMEAKRIIVGYVTYNTVIKGLCKAGRMTKADEVSKRFSGDNFTFSTLLHGYMKDMDVAGVRETKRRLEEAGICLDVVTCNVLIKALFMVGMVEDAVKLFNEMPQMGLVANCVTYCTMVDGCCKSGKIDEALQIFDEYRQNSAGSTAACHNCIIRGLCKEHLVEIAVEVFEDLIEKNLVLDTSICRTLTRAQFVEGGEERVRKFIQKMQKLEPKLLSFLSNDAVTFLCANNCFEGALEIYFLMRGSSIVITSKSYYLLLKKLVQGQMKHACQLIMNDFVKAYGMFESRMINILLFYLCKRNVDVAIQFLGIMGKQNVSVRVLTAIVCALKRENRANDAYEFLMAAEKDDLSLDVVIYSSVVDALCKEGHLGSALDLCESMKMKGMCPNIVMYNSVINGLCRQGSVVVAFRLFDSLEHNNVFPTAFTYAILISALSREGFMQDAKDLFGKMVSKGITPNTCMYNILINGYCSFGLIEEAQKLIMDMDENCLQLDAFTVSAVISGFCLKGDIQGALDLFTRQKRREKFPDFLGFTNLIKGLFYNGRVEEARSILRDMLQCAEVVDLINHAGDGLNIDESLVSLLGLACDQGRVKEVIDILNEVSLTAFPTWRSESDYRIKHLKLLQDGGDFTTDVKMPGSGEGGIPLMEAEVPRQPYDISKSKNKTGGMVDMSNKLCKLGKEDGSNKDHGRLIGKPVSRDFDSYYSIIASLCSKGELRKANSIVRTMLLSENC